MGGGLMWGESGGVEWGRELFNRDFRGQAHYMWYHEILHFSHRVF